MNVHGHLVLFTPALNSTTAGASQQEPTDPSHSKFSTLTRHLRGLAAPAGGTLTPPLRWPESPSP